MSSLRSLAIDLASGIHAVWVIERNELSLPTTTATTSLANTVHQERTFNVNCFDTQT